MEDVCFVSDPESSRSSHGGAIMKSSFLFILLFRCKVRDRPTEQSGLDRVGQGRAGSPGDAEESREAGQIQRR